MNQQIIEVQGPEESARDKMTILDHRFAAQIQQFIKLEYTIDDFPKLKADIKEEDIILKHRGVIGIRKISVIRQIVDPSVAPRLISLIKLKEYPQLRLEAAWAMTNIFGRDTPSICQEIVRLGGIPLFIKLLKQNKLKLAEQAVWGIGNIAATSIKYRDELIERKAILRIIKFARRYKNSRILERCCWALSNLCRGQPLSPTEKVRSAINFFCDIVSHHNFQDREILGDCLWSIKYHIGSSLSEKTQIQKMIPKLTMLFQAKLSELNIIIPSIRIMEEISIESEYTTALISCGVFKTLRNNLHHPKGVVIMESCWIISNLTAGTSEQVAHFLEDKELIKDLIDKFRNGRIGVRRQICIVFSNLAYEGDPQTVFTLYESQQIMQYYYLLLDKDAVTVDIVLTCVGKIFLFAMNMGQQSFRKLANHFAELGAFEKLERLQCDSSDTIIFNARNLLGYLDCIYN